MYRRHGSTEYDPEHYSQITKRQPNARVTMPNMIPNEIPTKSRRPRDTRLETAIDFQINTESSLANRYGTRQSRTRLVVGRATTFKKRGITVPESRTLPRTMTGPESRTPTANYQHTRSAGTKHREVHSPIETASSSKRTRGTIVKLDSGNGDDLSKISWIHPIAWIHKAG